MTLGEGKRKVYMLLDEYSSGGTITTDRDIENKMADFFDIAQKRAAEKQHIRKIYAVEREQGKTDYEMPADWLKLCAVWRGEKKTTRYTWRAGRLVIPEEDTAKISVEYCALPETITPETANEYIFEVSEAACQALPYFVASQQLIADLVMDYSGLYAIWQEMLSELPCDVAGAGEIRNVLFRR